MNSFEYIISELNKFILEFPKTRVRYEHDNSSETHFIEVVPNEIYHLDTQYIQWESEMFDRFVDLFPEENICFISGCTVYLEFIIRPYFIVIHGSGEQSGVCKSDVIAGIYDFRTII